MRFPPAKTVSLNGLKVVYYRSLQFWLRKFTLLFKHCVRRNQLAVERRYCSSSFLRHPRLHHNQLQRFFYFISSFSRDRREIRFQGSMRVWSLLVARIELRRPRSAIKLLPEAARQSGEDLRLLRRNLRGKGGGETWATPILHPYQPVS